MPHMTIPTPTIVKLGIMPYPIKLYIFTAAYKVIPTLIFNAILMWLNAT